MDNPRILILVLSFNEPPFSDLMKCQQATFDSVEVEGVRTVYYYGGSGDNFIWEYTRDKELMLPCGDKYYYMGEKLKLALEVIDMTKYFDYDIIFRTNSSSYVNKKSLVEFAKTLPTEKLYAGWTFKDSEDFGGDCVSGAGIFLSRDTAKILMDNIDPKFEQEEDVYAGRILRKHGITAIDDKSRYDVDSDHDYIPLSRYHYRFKGPSGNRLVDAHNMILLHNLIINQ